MLALKNRMPAAYHSKEFVEDGGLMTYSVSITRLVPTRRYLRRQDFERRKACRSARRTADEV